MYALIAILIYVSLRFEYRFSLGAVAALIHDVVITLGVFSILQLDFDLSVLAAILAVIGYSLNDTIVVFDRIRENLKKLHKKPLAFIVNRSINETLSRTILTSLTTLVVVVTLFVLGGGIIHDFAFALIIGIPLGVYQAIRQYSFFDQLGTMMSFITFSTPIFIIGVMLQLILAYQLEPER